ncbi:MAG: MFS transporter [Granulosicoccus sp.]
MTTTIHSAGQQANLPERLPLTIWLLSLCNAYLYICSSLLITVSALIGFDIAPNKSLATLPMAIQFFAIMCGTVPASLFMGHFGRKTGFLLAGCIGITGASIALWSVMHDHFLGYCIASVCFGLFAAFANYYRFTAAEVVSDSAKSRAIAMVMAGGVIAAFIGPNLANWSSELFSARAFAGPFAILIGVYLISMLTISLAELPAAPKRVASASSGRPLATIMLQPVFVVAVICQMLGYGAMNLVMSSTPLAMNLHAYGLGATALVIQWHVVAMFAPSFFTGHLISRFGVVPILASGVLLGIACVMVNLTGESLPHFIVALMLLGISWNFLFVGGTTLLTDTCTVEERSRTQAINDLLVFTTVTLTALTAGGMHHLFGWRIVNLSVLPMFAVSGLAIAWLYFNQKGQLQHSP